MSKSFTFSFVKQTVENDLTKYELQQANEQIKMLHSFMPESFLRRGGKQNLAGIMSLCPVPGIP